MLTYRGDKFVKGKKFTINENMYLFSKRDGDKLVFESVKDNSKYVITEEEFNESEKILTEKINQENKEINEIIGKVLRSKSLARKYEDKLKSLGITIDYDQPQGVLLKGPNGKTLGASSKEVYGPHTPDTSSRYNSRTGRYDSYTGHTDVDKKYEVDSYYSDRVKKCQNKIDELENLDRDGIIRKYHDLSTEEALAKHKEELAKAKEDLEQYKTSVEQNKKHNEKERINDRRYRREANFERLRTATDKEKADAAIDYLNYLSKPANDYMNDIRRSNLYIVDKKSKSNPENYIKKNRTSIDDYKDLKRDVDRAKDDVEVRTAGDDNKFRYSSAAMTDEQLEAKIQKMRDDLEKQIEELRSSNKENTEEKSKYEKALKDKEKALDDFLKSKGIRESVINIVKKSLNNSILTEGSAEDEEYFKNILNKLSDELSTHAREANDSGYHNLSVVLQNAMDIIDEYYVDNFK